MNDDMKRDTQEMVDLLSGPITRAMARRIAKKAKEKVTLFERSFHSLALYKFEDKEDIFLVIQYPRAIN